MRGVEHDRVPGKIETGRWYDIKIELQGSRIRCWLDGQLVHDIKNGSLKSLYAVAGLQQDTREIILKVVNAAGEAMDTALDLKGAPKLAPHGHCGGADFYRSERRKLLRCADQGRAAGRNRPSAWRQLPPHLPRAFRNRAAAEAGGIRRGEGRGSRGEGRGTRLRHAYGGQARGAWVD